MFAEMMLPRRTLLTLTLPTVGVFLELMVHPNPTTSNLRNARPWRRAVSLGPILDKALAACNAALAKVPTDLKTKLATKLIAKQRAEGKRAVTDSDRRRWLLPPDNRDKDANLTVDAKFRGWYHWEVPFDTDPDWPKSLQDAVISSRKAADCSQVAVSPTTMLM